MKMSRCIPLLKRMDQLLAVLIHTDNATLFQWEYNWIKDYLLISILHRSRFPNSAWPLQGNWNGKLKFSKHFLHSSFFTVRVFYTPHFPRSSLSTVLIFYTSHFPQSSFSTLLIFHSPHFLHSALYITMRKTGNRIALRTKVVSRFRFRLRFPDQRSPASWATLT